MRRLILSLLLLLIFPFATQAQDLTQDIVSEQAQLSFSVPDGWTSEYISTGFTYIILTGDDIRLDINTPNTFVGLGMDAIEKPNDLLAEYIEASGWEEGDFDTATVNGRILTTASYLSDDFEGVLVAVPLDDGQFAIVDTYRWDISLDYDLVLEVASTIETIPSPLTIEDYDADWRTVVPQLEEAGLIPPDGSLLFTEDRAFFEGQGVWFTPLASNSPTVNYVMAGTVSYTRGSDSLAEGELEVCALLGGILTDETGSATEFIEVGVDSNNVYYYLDWYNANVENYAEFSRLPLDESFHVMFVVQGEALTVFLNGEQIGSELPIVERAGTFGIALTGFGPQAECVGENIWVYQIPRLQTGDCRAVASGAVNKRTDAGTTFDIAGQLTPDVPEDVIARVTDQDGFVWWQL